MNTKYEEIVNVNAIGKPENPISLNDLPDLSGKNLILRGGVKAAL